MDVREPPFAMMGGVLAPDDLVDLSDKDRELLAEIAKIDGRLCGSSKLLELSRGLAVHESSKIENFNRLSSGEARLTFVTEHQGADGKPLLEIGRASCRERECQYV